MTTATSQVKTHETLNELEEQLALLEDYFFSEEESEKALAEQLISELLPRIEAKIDSFIYLIHQREASGKFRKAEAQRIQKLASSDFHFVNWAKEKLLNFLQRRVEMLGEKGKSIEGKVSKVTLCKNGGKIGVWTNSELTVNELPSEYVEYVPQINWEKLKEDARSSPDKQILNADGKVVASVNSQGYHVRLQ